ncbi:fimbria/pilus outer membrane usher protein, partial [Escherichia coli]|nr:fimbria/pilus outer membrane usher protein [Escherichia coli]
SDLGQSFQVQLDVIVEEAYGRTSTFQVASAFIPYLIRKGQVRYKSSLGNPTSVGHNDINNPFFWTSEASWGWLNNV